MRSGRSSSVICDVGGGYGLKLIEHPEMLLKDAPALLEQLRGLCGRDVPVRASRGPVVMKHIIHDVRDPEAVLLNRDGKILIMDAVIPGPNEPSSISSSRDTGRERTPRLSPAPDCA
jgi:hypothetical protein